MAQVQPEHKIHDNSEKDTQEETGNSSFKFNAQAPEFVPRSQSQMPISGYFYPCFQILGGCADSDWFLVGDQDPSCLIPTASVALPNSSKNILTPDLQQKIVKQVTPLIKILFFLLHYYIIFNSFLFVLHLEDVYSLRCDIVILIVFFDHDIQAIYFDCIDVCLSDKGIHLVWFFDDEIDYEGLFLWYVILSLFKKMCVCNRWNISSVTWVC